MATENVRVARWIGDGVSVINRIEASHDGRHPLSAARASLTSLLGPQRAEILRLPDVPATCGRIAESLALVPGGVTYDLRSLEAAGLVRRIRRGRHVHVERTARGRALMAHYLEGSAG